MLVGLVGSVAEAQRMRRGGYNNNNNQNQGGNGQQDQNANKSKLPDDSRLLEIHQAFIRGATKLALEYTKKNELDKAIACYREILRLVPGYGPAQAALTQIIAKQSNAKRVVIDIMASKGWQDSGIDVIEGKPVVIHADGHWKINMFYPVGGEGVEIPEELRRFNLGALIGIIIPPGEKPAAKIEAPEGGSGGENTNEQPAEQPAAQQPAEGDQAAANENPEAAAGENPGQNAQEGANAAGNAGGEKQPTYAAPRESSDKEKEEEDKKPRPFFIGHQAELFAKRSGRLYLRMYDSDADDNVGKIRVEIRGTFGPAVGDAASTGRSK